MNYDLVAVYLMLAVTVPIATMSIQEYSTIHSDIWKYYGNRSKEIRKECEQFYRDLF